MNQPGATQFWRQSLDSLLAAQRVTALMTGSRDPEIFVNDYNLLAAAAPFAWSEKTVDATLAASKGIPDDTTLERWNLPTDKVWWWFEKPLQVQTASDLGGVRAISMGWLNPHHFGVSVWVDAPDGFVVKTPVTPTQHWTWPRGCSVAEMLEGTRKAHNALYGPGGKYASVDVFELEEFMHATNVISRFVLAGLAWLEQQILTNEPGHIERHERKRLEKARGGKMQEIRVVHLRKMQQRPAAEPGEPTGRHLTVQFAVDGHWRNQPIGPGRTGRKLLYIHSYIKGPDDAPFKTPAKKLFLVDR